MNRDWDATLEGDSLRHVKVIFADHPNRNTNGRKQIRGRPMRKYRKSLIATLATAASIAAMTAAHAQQGTYVVLEGGLACARNKAYVELAGQKVGDNGCGGTGAIEFGRTGVPVLGYFDHWAIRGRTTSFKDDETAGIRTDTFKDKRLTLDAEVGAKAPWGGFFGGTSRITLGLRYAAWDGRYELSAPGGAPFSVVDDFEARGFGPRIGLRSHIPLGSNWAIESQTGLAALFADHKFTNTTNGTVSPDTSRSRVVYSFESTTLLSYMPSGNLGGLVLSAGVTSEYAFRQINADDGTANGIRQNRHSWGPVARVRIPLQ